MPAPRFPVAGLDASAHMASPLVQLTGSIKAKTDPTIGLVPPAAIVAGRPAPRRARSPRPAATPARVAMLPNSERNPTGQTPANPFTPRQGHSLGR